MPPTRHLNLLWLPALYLIAACAGDGTGLDENGNPINPAVGVTLAVDDVALPVGSTFQLVATTTDGTGTIVTNRPVTWASSDPGVAEVDATGLVTAVGPGSASITATSDGARASAAVSVVASATFAADVQPIFSGNCAFSGCHAGPTPQQGQNLSAGNAYANIVGVFSRELPTMLRIDPGQPLTSYLVHKIRGTQLQVGGQGVRMPFGGQLTQPEIDVIRAWVQAGALNN